MEKPVRKPKRKIQQQTADWWVLHCRVHNLDQHEEEKKLLKILKLRDLLQKISIVALFCCITKFLSVNDISRCMQVCRLWTARGLDPYVWQHAFMNESSSGTIMFLDPPKLLQTFHLVKYLRLSGFNVGCNTQIMCDRIVVRLVNLEEITIESFYDIDSLKKIFDAFAGKLSTIYWMPTYNVEPYLYNHLVFHKLKVLTLFMYDLTAEVVYDFLEYLSRGNAPELESLTLEFGIWNTAQMTSFACSSLMYTEFMQTVLKFKRLSHFKVTSLSKDSLQLQKFKVFLTTDEATKLLQGSKVVIEVSECK
jgi:hypothetical protein